MLLSTEELRRAEAFEHGKTLEHGKIKFEHEKSTSLQCREVLLVRLTGIEPTHPAPEAGALPLSYRRKRCNNYYISYE